MNSEDNAVPLELGSFEIKNEAHTMLGNFQVVQYLTPSEIRDSVNDLAVHDNGRLRNEIWNVLTHRARLVVNANPTRPFKGDTFEPEFHGQCILVGRFV